MGQAEDALRHFYCLWKRQFIPDWEWTAAYIAVLGLAHRPSDFIGGPHGQNFGPGPTSLSGDEFLRPFSDRKLSWQKHFCDEVSFFHFLCGRSLRSIPLAVNRSLVAWAEGRYPLVVREDIPTGDEVLEMQTRGRRCVSVLMDPSSLRSFHEGRDALSFVIHDLIHADHFFRDPVHTQAQITFLRGMKRVSELEFLKQMRAGDQIFRADWDYLVSDMNSVPLHLLKTLKAFLLMAFKRARNVDTQLPLKTADEADFQERISQVGSALGFGEVQQRAWKALNGPDFIFPEQAVALSEFLSTPAAATEVPGLSVCLL